MNMNKEMQERIQEVRKYKKLAIQALLPKEVVPHIEIIENELKEIVGICLLDKGTVNKNENTKKCKRKVTIV